MQPGGAALYGQEPDERNDGKQEQTGAQFRGADVRRQAPEDLFSSLLFSSLILCSLGFVACTGNGGAANSNGEVYVPGGSSSSGSGSSTSGSSGDTETFTAQDLLDAANSGDPGRIIELISAAPSGDESGETTTVVLSAAVLGLPAGGTVTLTITGAMSFDETKGAADDGTVTFIIPKVVTGKTVTIELSVKDETGFVIYYGKETGPVEGSGNLDITLHRQYRTHATADKTVLTATASSAELATITITGATETPLLTPSSALLNTDPPVQDAFDPETYTVSVGIPGGTAPVWFADDTIVNVNVKVGTEEHTIKFTLKNKYTVEVEYTASDGSPSIAALSTPYMQGGSITFAAANGAVTSTQGNRGVAAFKYGSSIVLYKTAATGATSVTINSTNFPGLASRTISLEAVLNFDYTASGGHATGSPVPAGTETDPFVLVYGSTDSEETCIDLYISDFSGTMSTTSNSDGKLTISGSDTDSPAIMINTSVITSFSAIPAAGTKYKITMTDSGTGSKKEFWVHLRKRVGSKTAPDTVGDIVFADGSASAYTDTLTADQIAEAAAIIFDASNKKGLGLNLGTNLKWCSSSALAYGNNTYAKNYTDGKANTDEISALSDYNATNYPAFWYCTSYSTPGYTSDWYLPVGDELEAIRTNKTIIGDAFAALGLTFPTTASMLSSYCYGENTAYFIILETSGSGAGYGKTNNYTVFPVHVFN